MEGKQKIDLRIYELCRAKLQLSDEDAVALSLELQGMLEEERAFLLKKYLEGERTERADFEAFIEQRIEFLRVDLHNMHTEFSAELRQTPSPGHYTDILQWMFTYFAFLMGGLVAVILLLLKK